MSQKTVKEKTLIREMFYGSLVVLIFTNISTMLGALVDGIVISQGLGGDAMAAFTIVSPMFNIFVMISGVMSSGTQVLFTKLIGKGDSAGARSVFNTCFFSVLFASILFGILIFVLASPLGMLLGASGKDSNLLPMAIDYLYGLAPGMPAFVLLPILNGFMQIDNDKKVGVIAIATMTIANIIGDLVNVYVIGGGMFGMSFSTSVSMYAGVAIILLMHFTKKNILLRFSLKSVRLRNIGGILNNGLPYAIFNGSLMLQRVALNYLLLHVAGQWAVGALGVTFTFFGFVDSIMIGVGQTSLLIAGVSSGEEDRGALRELERLALRFVTIAMAAMAVIILIFTPLFVRIFMDPSDGASYEAALYAFRTNAVGLPFMGINTVFIMYLQGIRNMWLTRLLSFFEKGLYIVVICVVLGFLFGANGVWIGMAVAEVLVMLTIFLFSLPFRKNAGSFADALLFLPKDFGVDDKDVLELAVASEQEIVEASEKAQQFIHDRDGTLREGLMIPLSIEEMAGNAFRYGFSDEKDHRKDHRIEIRLFHKDAWILRIKDNCAPFDPVKWLEIHSDEDKVANIGIRMVSSVSKDFSYVSTMKMNNVLIQV